MRHRLEVPLELNHLIEKRKAERRAKQLRQGAKQRAAADAQPTPKAATTEDGSRGGGAEERRSGQERRKIETPRRTD